MNDEQSDTSPLEPSPNEIVIDDQGFDKLCQGEFRVLMEKADWQFSQILVSQSEKWGLLWRADVKRAGGESSSRETRLMCWRSPDTEGVNSLIAIAQALTPLRKG